MYKILKNIIEMDDYSVQKQGKSQPPEPFEWNTVEGKEVNVDDCIGGKGKITVKGNTEQASRILPEGYTQVDYIQSHGQEYIDTGVNADSNLRTILDMTYDEPTSSNQNVGVINMGNSQLRYHILPQNGFFRIYIQNTTYAINTIAIDTNRHLYDIDVPNRIIKLDENEYTLSNSDFDTQLNFWLFGRNSDSTIYKSKNKLYKCKMYVSGVLVRDFVPCYRNSDNEVGLYDLANDVFYTNDGNDAFTYGSVVDIPNPDYPQDIKVVTGNNFIKNVGKNRFGITETTTSVVGVDLSMKDSEISMNGTSIGGKLTTAIAFKNKLPAGTYCIKPQNISGTCVNKSSGHVLSINITDSSNNKIIDKWLDSLSTSFTLTEETQLYFSIYVANGSQFNNYRFGIQIEEGTTQTPYETYREEEYGLDLWKTNEFDCENVNKLNAYFNSTGKILSSTVARTLYIQCKPSTLYKISKIQSARFQAMYTTETPQVGVAVNGAIADNSATELYIKTGNDAKYLCVFYYHTNADTLTEQEILNSIKIQEAMELCKIEDYQDILFKNVVGDGNYNAELESGAWYKKNCIEKDVLDGTDQNITIDTNSTNTTRIYLKNTQQNASKSIYGAKQFSNCLIFGAINSLDQEGFYAGSNKTTVVRMRKSLIGTDTESVNNYLAQNNIIIYFVMSQPTYTKITDTTLISQLEALRKAKWFKGVNRFWTETENLEPMLEGTYKQAVESEVP